MNKIKVLLHYIIYPMAIATYFCKALEHREDVDLKVAGPYTSTWIPWMGGMTLPNKYAVAPDIPVPFAPNIGEYNYEIIRSLLGDWKPDLIIQIDAGLHFKYKPTDGMVVTVGTDPHVLNDWYDAPRKYSDKFFNMQAVYSKAGDIYLPYAYSQYDHYPMDIEKSVDCVLIGLPYTHVPRVQWVEELRKRGLTVIFQNGPVFDEAREMYNMGRIGLNWSSMDDLNARAFEIAAMKLAPVMNFVPDMYNFPDEIFGDCFRTLEEAIERVMFLMKFPEICASKTEKAYQLVQGQHYDARVEQILKECGFI